MHSLFSELRKLRDDILAVAVSPHKVNSMLHISLYSNALYLMMANGINYIFGFVFWIVVARLYTTEVVGVASAILSVVSLLAVFSELGLGYGLIRFLKSSNYPVELINSSFTLTGVLSLVAAIIFILGLNIWSPGLNIIRQNPYYLVAFLILVPVQVLDDLTDQVMMARRQAKFIFARNFIFNILRLVFPVLLVVFFQFFGIFGSWTAATFIALLIGLYLMLPRVQPNYHPVFMVDRKILSEALHFSFLNYLGDLFWIMPGQLLPIIIINLLGAKSNAYFFIAWAMGGILTIIPVAIATSLLAEGTHDETRLKDHIQRSFRMIVLLMIPAVALVWFLADKFLMFYGGLYAENAVTLLRWLAIAAFPLSINIVYFSIKRLQKKVKPIILLNAFMAFTVILASYLLLPRLGINGVGIAWLGGQSLIALIVMVWDMKNWVRLT
jgi:O-antigen/teichoic acid export membrane protein